MGDEVRQGHGARASCGFVVAGARVWVARAQAREGSLCRCACVADAELEPRAGPGEAEADRRVAFERGECV